ncbi:unnamed protein product [Moneuplotes crassus]|uniref:Uncharacterized protein n=1 Tax=Euplotes crassus TaxID=5936 RepID=A0AAD2D9W1_EUPCR|nr:unnamed protein product [Moneuplotes crassus]
MSNNPSLTERKYYVDQNKTGWTTRNNFQGFHPQGQNNDMNNTMYAEEGIGDMNGAMARNSSLEYNPVSRQMLDSRGKFKPASRKQKARRTLRQSLLKAYNNKPNFGGTGMRFNHNITKKKKQGNIFSGDQQINFDSGIRVNRNILPSDSGIMNNTLTTGDMDKGQKKRVLSFSNSNQKISTARGRKSSNDNIFTLKRQIKDLREMLKEKDVMLRDQRMNIAMNTIDNTYDDRDALVQENQDLRHQLNLITSKQGETSFKEINNLKRENEGLKKGYNQINELLEQKDIEIKQCENLIKQKDDLIKYLKEQLKGYMNDRNQEWQKVMEEQKSLKAESKATGNIEDPVQITQEFFLRFSSFCFKKKLTLYKIIHSKIFDKMINGVETELITVKHFWRLLQKTGFKTITSEKEAVTSLVKNKILYDIIEVKGLKKIMAQLGILENLPVSTKNFCYETLSGAGIRLMNRIIRDTEGDIESFLKKEGGILDHKITKKVIAGSKSEMIDVINSDDFLKILKKFKIMKRWEDLDENLQIFLSLPTSGGQMKGKQEDQNSVKQNLESSTITFLSIQKIRKCLSDFQKFEFFEYYGYTQRTEGEIDSEDEPDTFNPIETMRNRLTTIKNKKSLVKKVTIMPGSAQKKNYRKDQEFTNFDPEDYQKAKTSENRKEDFYEVDLSEEENRKDKKTVMSMRRKQRRTTKGRDK